MIAGAVTSFGRIRPTLRAGLLQWPIWSYCLLSFTWSSSPGTTLRRSILLFAYFIFGHYAYATAGTRGAIRALNVASWIMIVTSLVLFVAVPSVGQDVGSYEGALRGIFSQKNVTAWTFQLALAYLGYRLYADRRVGVGFLLGVPVIIGAIVLTRSTTELLACFLLITFWIWSAWFRSARLKLLPLWAAACLLAAIAFTLWGLGDDAYRVLGKDPGLTGRGPIWEMAERAIAARPWFGHGFQGFWLILVVFKAHAEPVYLQLDMSTALVSFSTIMLGMQQREWSRQAGRARTDATASRTGLGWSASS